uniref:Lipid body protein 62 n=1 Tax=Lobosphaera incisa TaxID=312850 RepID=A0A1X9QDR9_9CHLO|nr:lipid body protein 62 [Lobosphaera incisa]
MYNADGSMRAIRRPAHSSGGGQSSWSGGWAADAKENEPRNTVGSNSGNVAGGPSPAAAGMKSKSAGAEAGKGSRQPADAKIKALQGSNIFGNHSDAATVQDTTAKLQQVQVQDMPAAGSATIANSGESGVRDISDAKRRALYQTNVFTHTDEPANWRSAEAIASKPEVPAVPAGSAGQFRAAEPGARDISDAKKKSLYQTRVFGTADAASPAAQQVSSLKHKEMSGHNIFGAAEEPAPRAAGQSGRRPPGGASTFSFGNSGAESAAAPSQGGSRQTAGGSSTFSFGW